MLDLSPDSIHLPSCIGQSRRGAVSTFLQKLDTMAHDRAGRTQVQILARSDRLAVRLMRSCLSFPTKAGDPSPLTIHEFRNAFVHAWRRRKAVLFQL